MKKLLYFKEIIAFVTISLVLCVCVNYNEMMENIDEGESETLVTMNIE